MTKQHTSASTGPAPQGDGAPEIELWGGLVKASAGDRGLCVYPGQSPEEVLAVAHVLEKELDTAPYVSDDVARKILLAIGR